MPLRLPTDTAVHRLASAGGRRGHALKERLLRYFLVVLVVRTVEEMSADDATHMAAGVAYYIMFSIFPLLLGLTAIFSLFLESTSIRETVETELTGFVTDFLPGSGDVVKENIQAARDFRGALGLFAIVGLIWSGSAVFGAVTRAVNRAWDVHQDRPFFISKPRQLAMALGVGILFTLSMSSATVARFAGQLDDFDVPGLTFLVEVFGLVLLQGTSFILMLIIFLLIYKFMPNTKTYWRYIWPGALLAAVLFELAKNLFIFYLERFASFDNIYGSLAPVIILLTWAYLSSLIVILGAELSSEYGRMRQGVNRGVLLHPTED